VSLRVRLALIVLASVVVWVAQLAVWGDSGVGVPFILAAVAAGVLLGAALEFWRSRQTASGMARARARAHESFARPGN